MLGPLLATITDPTVPPTTTPVADDGGAGATGGDGGVISGVGEVIRTVVENLGANGYQTGVALVVATVAIVAMLNIDVHKAVLVPVGIGAFWAGWLGWNTMTGQDNPLFPGDVSATKIWDVALAGDTGFLIVVMVSCAAAILLWRKGTALAGRIMLIVGAILGASFLYNLVEAVRYV